jgi:hypothetical protein
MNEKKYFKAKMSFQDSKATQHTIEVVHNLGEGDDIHRALKLWLTQTEDYSVGDFCEFVISKSPEEFICLTIPEWNDLLNQV